MQNYIETSILQVNNNSFTGLLIIGTFEKRAPGPGCSRQVKLTQWQAMTSKLSLIPFAYSLKIGCSKKKTENYPGKCFWKERKGDVKNQP